MAQAQQQAPDPDDKGRKRKEKVSVKFPDTIKIEQALDSMLLSDTERTAETPRKGIDLSLRHMMALSSIVSPREIYEYRKHIARTDTDQSIKEWIIGLEGTNSSASEIYNAGMSSNVTEITESRMAISGRHFPKEQSFLRRENAVVKAIQQIKGWKSSKIVSDGSTYELHLDWSDSPEQILEITDRDLFERIKNSPVYEELVSLTEKLMTSLEGLDKDGEKVKKLKRRFRGQSRADDQVVLVHDESGCIEPAQRSIIESAGFTASVAVSAATIFGMGAGLLFFGYSLSGLTVMAVSAVIGYQSWQMAKNVLQRTKEKISNLLD